MKELKPSGLIAIEVPEHAMGAVTYQSEYSDKYVLRWIDDIINIVDLPKGKWELIGSVTAEHIDFDVEPNVEAVGDDDYKDYTHHLNVFADENDSFRSLLTANDVHFVNPYGEKEPSYNLIDYGVAPGAYSRYAQERVKWQQAESKLVEKILILKPL